MMVHWHCCCQQTTDGTSARAHTTQPRGPSLPPIWQAPYSAQSTSKTVGPVIHAMMPICHKHRATLPDWTPGSIVTTG